MMMRRLMYALLGCGFLALMVLGCVIEERKYDESIPIPLESVVQGSSSALPTATDAQCRQYCRIVKSNCTGRYAVYVDDGNGDDVDNDCMAICRRLPAGSGPGDKSDSVECRRANAVEASSEQSESSCAGAGPGGNKLCGETCVTYCNLRASICGDPALGQDVDLERCKQTCPALEQGDIYNSDPMTREDTLQCRLNHLVFASRSPEDARTHCPHTSVVPQRPLDPPCADQRGTDGNCEKYCNLVDFSCRDSNQVYESVGQCLAVCKALPLGKAEELGDKPGENTVGCRRYHAYAALSSANAPVIHCPHAGPLGDGHCGAPATDNNCFSYCRILKRACPARFYQTYLGGQTPPSIQPDNPPANDNLGSCMDSCLPVAGSLNESRYSVERAPVMDSDDDDDPQGDKGDVLQCMTFHAIRALGGRSGQAPNQSECAEAFGGGSCQ